MTDYDLGALEAFDSASCITLVAAAHRMIGHGGRRLNYHTACRWANPKHGCRIGDQRLLLPTVRLGWSLYVMPSWIREFEKARAKLGARGVSGQGNRPRLATGRENRLAHEACLARLRAVGIG